MGGRWVVRDASEDAQCWNEPGDAGGTEEAGSAHATEAVFTDAPGAPDAAAPTAGQHGGTASTRDGYVRSSFSVASHGSKYRGDAAGDAPELRTANEHGGSWWDATSAQSLPRHAWWTRTYGHVTVPSCVIVLSLLSPLLISQIVLFAPFQPSFMCHSLCCTKGVWVCKFIVSYICTTIHAVCVKSPLHRYMNENCDALFRHVFLCVCVGNVDPRAWLVNLQRSGSVRGVAEFCACSISVHILTRTEAIGD